MNQLLLRTKQNKNLDPSTQEPTTMTKRVCFLLSCVFCFAVVLPLFSLLWSVCFMEAIMCLSVLFCTFLLKVFFLFVVVFTVGVRSQKYKALHFTFLKSHAMHYFLTLRRKWFITLLITSRLFYSLTWPEVRCHIPLQSSMPTHTLFLLLFKFEHNAANITQKVV